MNIDSRRQNGGSGQTAAQTAATHPDLFQALYVLLKAGADWKERMDDHTLTYEVLQNETDIPYFRQWRSAVIDLLKEKGVNVGKEQRAVDEMRTRARRDDRQWEEQVRQAAKYAAAHGMRCEVLGGRGRVINFTLSEQPGSGSTAPRDERKFGSDPFLRWMLSR